LDASIEGPPTGMLGRITGSSSIETLVRVGIEKEAAGKICTLAFYCAKCKLYCNFSFSFVGKLIFR